MGSITIASGTGPTSAGECDISNCHLADLDGEVLNLYGSGAIPALDKNWGVQAASHVTTVSFKFIDFDQVSGRERSKISLYMGSAFVHELKKVTELRKKLVVWKPQPVSQRLLFRRSPLFYNPKYLDCIGALFLRLEEEYWLSVFGENRMKSQCCT